MIDVVVVPGCGAVVEPGCGAMIDVVVVPGCCCCCCARVRSAVCFCVEQLMCLRGPIIALQCIFQLMWTLR